MYFLYSTIETIQMDWFVTWLVRIWTISWMIRLAYYTYLLQTKYQSEMEECDWTIVAYNGGYHECVMFLQYLE